MTQSQIEYELHKLKVWYYENYRLCVFCGHEVRTGDLAHIIRRSANRNLITCKLNTGLAHRGCHTIYDDSPDQAFYLPRIIECLYITFILDRDYFNQYASHFPDLFDVFEQFPDVEYKNITHHGEIIQLRYLLT